MSSQHILIIGNPIKGLTFEGPFESHGEAEYAGHYIAGEWWIADLENPKQTKSDKLAIQRENLLFAIAHRFLREYDSEIHDSTMKELVAELDKVERQLTA